MKRYGAAVVGLGNIGQGYDYHSDELILTHARAFARHPGFELLAGVDPDPGKRERFERQYRVPAYGVLSDLLAAASPEVIALAVPTERHSETLSLVLRDAAPRAVLCEKPMAATIAEGRGMLSAAAAGGCVLAVNYVRRFDPGVQELKQALDGCEYGQVYKGVAWYTKGLRENGTHLVDLSRYLLGEVVRFALIDRGRRPAIQDPEPDFRVRFGDTEVYFLAAREECFSHFRIELIATGGRIVYADGGNDVRGRRVRDDPVFSGYRQLDPANHRFRSDMGRYQLHALDSLYRHLTDGAPLVSDGQSALATQMLVEDIINSCEST